DLHVFPYLAGGLVRMLHAMTPLGTRVLPCGSVNRQIDPRTLFAVARLKRTNRFVQPQRQRHGIQPLEQHFALKMPDPEAVLGSIRGPHDTAKKVNRQRTVERLRRQLMDGGLGQLDRQQSVSDAVVLKNGAEARGDDGTDTELA